MNIFVLDLDHEKNAQYHVDKHCSKMIVEYAQMLSTAVRLSGVDAGYKISHRNHPCTRWVGESRENWLWLRDLLDALNTEWKYRYNHERNHKSFDVAMSLPIPKLPSVGLTPFAQAMPEYCKCNNAVRAYRRYYRWEKNHIASWKNRKKPRFFRN